MYSSLLASLQVLVPGVPTLATGLVGLVARIAFIPVCHNLQF
jgi:hypothetical protein